ncbi:MAG: hypothetical protein K8S15_01400 [Candidatus Aegiribacteria sp.]|nr:hypothetical protein [Candidatus Aegiribacteria sp.]
MKNLLIVLALAAAFTFTADSYPVEDPVAYMPGTDDALQYDDGTSYWIVSGAAYYGTWFDMLDFTTNPNYEFESTEWWFYHHASLPWDTDQIVLELWAGDVTGPATPLASDHVTAIHNAPVIVNYLPGISIETDFWMIANTIEYSILGLPSVIYDQFNNFTGIAHSYYQNGLLWEPVVRAGYEIDALFRVYIIPTGAGLNNESWGAIKGLFR